MELYLKQFLNTKNVFKNKETTQVCRKENKVALPLLSKVPNGYNQNAITTNYHRFQEAASNLDGEIRTVTKKILQV